MTNRFRSSLDRDITAIKEEKLNGVVKRVFNTSIDRLERSISDVVIPGYAKKIANGEVVNNPCTMIVSNNMTIGVGSHTASKPGTVYSYTGPGSLTSSMKLAFSAAYLPGTLSIPSGFGDVLADEAKAKAIADIDSTPYSFAEDLFEIKETINFLRNPVYSLQRLKDSYLKDVERLKRRKKSLQTPKAAAQVYLEYRFAFSPLVRSIFNAVKAYADKDIKRPKRRTSRGSASDTYFQSQRQTKGTSSVNAVWDLSVEREIDYRAAILYEVSNPVTDWRFKYGLRFKDIPETLWAVFPMSFMYDRLWDASTAIRGLTNLSDPYLAILAGSVTKRETTVRTTSFVGRAQTGYSISVSPDTDVGSTFIYTRTPWNPSAADTIPPIKVGNLFNSITKVADVIALVTQSLMTKRRKLT